MAREIIYSKLKNRASGRKNRQKGDDSFPAPATMAMPGLTQIGADLVLTWPAAPNLNGGTLDEYQFELRDFATMTLVSSGEQADLSDTTFLSPAAGTYAARVRVRSNESPNPGGWSVAATTTVEMIPVSYANIVFMGASIMQDTFGAASLVTPSTRTAAFKTAGLDVDVYSYAVNGENIADIVNTRLDQVLTAFPNDDTLIVIHIGGNNITPVVPYATADLTSLNSQLAALTSKINASPAKSRIVLANLTFRTYQTITNVVSAADSAGLPRRSYVFDNENLGSGPFNENVFEPAYATLQPQFTNTDGKPFLDLYNFVRNDYDNIVSTDGIHPSVGGRNILAQFFIDRLNWLVNGGSMPATIVPATAAPVNVNLPTITGTLAEGETLTAVPGSYTGTLPLTRAYQWRRDGVAISGATGITYVVQSADVTAEVTVVETVTGVGSVSATSAPITSGVTPTALRAFINFTAIGAPNVTDSAINTISVVGAFPDGTTSGPALADVLDTSGTATGVGYSTTLSPAADGGNAAGGAGGNVMGQDDLAATFNDTLNNVKFTSTSLYAGANVTVTHLFTGLDSGKTYRISLIGSRAAPGPRVADFTFSDATVISHDACATPTPNAVSHTIAPTAGGELSFAQSSGSSGYHYCGGILIEEIV